MKGSKETKKLFIENRRKKMKAIKIEVEEENCMKKKKMKEKI